MFKLKSLGLFSIILVLLLTSAFALDSNIQLSTQTPSIKSNPCQVSQFSFIVRNTGLTAETYEFGSKGLEAYTTLSTNAVLLLPGEAAQVDLFVNPSCDIYGTKDLKFQALARSSQILAEADVVLDIQRNYDYSVTIPGKANVCNYKQAAIPIGIKNNVPFVNQFDIKVTGPSFLKQEARAVELAPLDSGITNLVSQATNPGSYIINIKTTSLRGDVSKEGAFNLTVEKCYSADPNIDKPSDIIVSGHKAQYKITVKNDGTKQDTYEFELDSPEFVSVNATKITLNPGETKTFTLTALPVNITGDFKATFRTESLETGFVKEDSISLKVISLEDAYKSSINPKKTRILYGQDAVAIDIKNNGILPATYDFNLNAADFLKLTTTTLTLQPDEKGTVYLQSDAKDSEKEGNYETQLIASVKGEAIGFTSKFNTKLRKLTMGQEIKIFVTKYLYFVIAGAVLIVILIVIAVFGRRIRQSWRNFRIKRKELAKIRNELKARKREEKLAKKLLKNSMKKPSSFGRKLLGILMILIALVVLIGGAIVVTGYAPVVQELLLKQQANNKFEPIIKVDTTGLEAYGNTVIVRGKETDIPIVVRNNYDSTLLFDVEVEESWIKTDTKEIELEAGEQETINLRVAPRDDTNGVYKITVSANLEKDNKVFKEDVTLNVRNKNLVEDLLDYIWYLVGGLVVLVIGTLITGRKPKKDEKKQDLGFSEIKYKPLKKVSVDLPKKR